MAAIDDEKPLLGRPLDEVLSWKRPADAPPAATASREPRAQVGPGAGDHSLRAGSAGQQETIMNERLQDAIRRRTSVGRWRHGHAAHARRTRAGQLRRGLEPDASRAGAGDPAPLRRGRLGLHPHQHLRRLAHHAEPPRQRGQGGRDQPGRGGDRARGLRRPRRLRDRRHRSVRRADGAVRRLHRSSRCARPSTSRRRRWSTPAPTPSSSRRRPRSKNCGSASRRRSEAGRALHHRLDGLRRDARRLHLPHHDGHRPGARRGVHGGARRAISSR